MAQWESFLKKRSYSGRCKSRPCPVPPLIPPSASASSEAGRLCLSPFSRREGGGFLASGGECDSDASSLSGVRMVGPSRSQESTVLSRSAPPSVDYSASVERDLGWGSSGAAPTLTLPGPPCHMTGSLGKGDVVPAHGLVGRVPGLASSTFAPRPARGLVDACALTRALHAPLLPACGLSGPGPGPGLRTAPEAVGFARALRVTARSLDESAPALLAAAGPAVIVHNHVVPGFSHGRGVTRFVQNHIEGDPW